MSGVSKRCAHCDRPASHIYQLPDGETVPLCNHHYEPIRAGARTTEKARAKKAAAR